VVALAELVGDDKSQLSRTPATLEERGYVERDPATLGHRFGLRVLGLAASAADRRLLDAAGPVVRELVAELGESVHLSVRQGDPVLTLLSESPPATFSAPGGVGGLTPLATTSAGRVLVSDLRPSELDGLGLGTFVELASRDALVQAAIAWFFGRFPTIAGTVLVTAASAGALSRIAGAAQPDALDTSRPSHPRPARSLGRGPGSSSPPGSSP